MFYFLYFNFFPLLHGLRIEHQNRKSFENYPTLTKNCSSQTSRKLNFSLNETQIKKSIYNSNQRHHNAISISSFFYSSGISLTSSTVAGLGCAVSIGGDINDDGFGEILIGSNGKAFLLYGSSTFSTPVNLDTNAVAFTSSLTTSFGNSVSVGGDIDGDGVPDLLIGEPSSSNGATASAGRAVVIFGDTVGLNSMNVLIPS